MYETYQSKISDCDRAIQAHMQTFDNKADIQTHPLPQPKGSKPSGNAPQFDLRSELYRITGVDLTSIDGIDVMTAQTLISEVGVDISPWKTEKRFASWLALAPCNHITGGKVIKRGTKQVKNRAAHALRMAASTLLNSKSALGANYRRLRARLGPAKAITAMAHKLARIIYRMLKYGQRYVDKGMQYYESKYQQQQIRYLNKRAQKGKTAQYATRSNYSTNIISFLRAVRLKAADSSTVLPLSSRRGARGYRSSSPAARFRSPDAYSEPDPPGG